MRKLSRKSNFRHHGATLKIGHAAARIAIRGNRGIKGNPAEPRDLIQTVANGYIDDCCAAYRFEINASAHMLGLITAHVLRYGCDTARTAHAKSLANCHRADARIRVGCLAARFRAAAKRAVGHALWCDSCAWPNLP